MKKFIAVLNQDGGCDYTIGNKGERIIRDSDGKDSGVRENQRGAMYIDHKVFFNHPKTIEKIEQLKNSQLIRDIRNRKNGNNI